MASEQKQHGGVSTCSEEASGQSHDKSQEFISGDNIKTHAAAANAEELLTPEDAARELKVTSEQVRNLIRHGQLAAVNVGAGKKRPLYRITRQGLQDFLSRRYQSGPAVRPKRFRRLPAVPDLFPNLR